MTLLLTDTAKFINFIWNEAYSMFPESIANSIMYNSDIELNFKEAKPIFDNAFAEIKEAKLRTTFDNFITGHKNELNDLFSLVDDLISFKKEDYEKAAKEKLQSIAFKGNCEKQMRLKGFLNEIRLETNTWQTVNHRISDIYSVILNIKEILPKEQEPVKVITGFNTNLNETKIIELYNNIKGNLISAKTKQANFIAALNNVALPKDFQKIYWDAEESIFCCLFFGYSNLEYNSQLLDFKGIVKSKDYKLATQLFEFRTKTTNKTLSSKVAKLVNCKHPNNFHLIYPIIEQY